MPKPKRYAERRFVIGAVAACIVLVYIIRLFFLQLVETDYKLTADSNAFRRDVVYPSRGLISDRNDSLLVYNEPSYTILVQMMEQHGVDTLAFCRTLGISREDYIRRMDDIKDSEKNPHYSRYKPQVFMSGIPQEEFSRIREKLFRFKGFYVEKRSTRKYVGATGAHVLGDVGEVSPSDLGRDFYYQSGDIIGKLGVERSYEKELRGEKGVRIMMRDVRGRTLGHYKDGLYDTKPVAGKDLKLTIDIELQALAERLLEGKLGAVVAIEPETGEILCCASSPTFDPRQMTGKDRARYTAALHKDSMRPMFNRAVMGTYPPGSTFKPTQGLIGLQEQIISPGTSFPCNGGFHFKGLHLKCHGHASPLPLVPALATSCNAFFCWNLYRMFNNRSRFASQREAMTRWKDHLVAMGYGYRLGVDLPGEARGMIPNADYYDKYLGKWGPLSVISISIGQGEVTATPLQICNLAATIANRGWYVTPHVVRSVGGEKPDAKYEQRHRTLVDAGYYRYAVAGMRAAVTGGTCRAANLPGLAVCGKTGTAQNRGVDHSAFMGFAPMDKPRIAVAVYVENGGFGADFGVPIGALIIERYLRGSLSPEAEARASAMQHKHISYVGYK
ncbi:MAG: penicillin-binding protein 2 [Bacteroidaceae bacterium]|nr:penicillin-binding protein 2 [Bacteroidaceae bacterium]